VALTSPPLAGASSRIVRHVGPSGTSSPSIWTRSTARLDDLTAWLTAERQVALDQERQRLEQALEPLYRMPANLALVPDSQGLGAPRERPTATG
jgi:hypothetical protein